MTKKDEDTPMCCRYRIREVEDDDDELEEILAILQRRPAASGVKTHGDALPTDLLPVIARNRRGEQSAFAMRWGMTAAGGCVINARSETAAQKPLFAEGMKNRRCLIPAKWYYEWETRGREKVRYAIRPQEKGLVYMAGIYRLDAAKGEPQFAVLTREAAGEIALIHPRMPVMIPRNMTAQWLDSRCGAQQALRAAITKLNFGAA